MWGQPGCHQTRPGNSRQPAGESQQLPLAWCSGCQSDEWSRGKEKANKGVPNLDAASFFFFLADH